MRRDIKKMLQLRRIHHTRGGKGDGSTTKVRKYVAAISRQVQMTSDGSNYK